MRTVGVLGGMGPAATLDFLGKLQARTGAQRDSDHIRTLVDINPQVPNRNEALAGDGESPAAVLVRMAQGLEAAGAEGLVIACNSAYAWADDIRAAVEIPLIDLIAATADTVLLEAQGAHHVGVLAASACLSAELYQHALAARGIAPIILDEAAQARFMQLIYRMKGGEVGADARREMHAFAFALIDQGAKAVVAACTEIPLVLRKGDLPVPLIDSTDVLVAETLAFARDDA
jgi:aspartate racemase